MSLILTPVSFGEVLDKITILEIKAKNIDDPEKQKNVINELDKLLETWNLSVTESKEISSLKSQLKKVNQSLWNIEDRIRVKEFHNEFDDEFIKVARSVYFENDKRADIKKEVNLLLGSELIEEKSYKNYK
jgi:hypothetical protein